MRAFAYGTLGSRIRAVACCIPLLASVTPRASVAQAEGDVALSWEHEACSQLPVTEVVRLLGLELATQRSAAADGGDGTQPHATLACEGLVAHVRVMGAGPLELELDLAESRPEARARVLALAIAELIATARLEPARAAPPRPSQASEIAPVRLGLSFAGGAARVLEPAAIAPAFALGAVQRWAAFMLQADMSLELARLQRDQADVHARDLSLSLAPGWLLSGERLAFGLALGVRAGHVLLTATARNSQQRGLSLSGWVVAPIARAQLELAWLHALSMHLRLEAGYVIKPLRGFDADGQSLVAMRGLRVAALLGVSLWFDDL